jgi:LacI family transcriptional regulator
LNRNHLYSGDLNRNRFYSPENKVTDLGHRRIGFITGRLELVSASRRLQGYKEGLAAAGIPLDETLIQIGDYEAPRAIECARALFSLEDPPTAIFASNDWSAMGVGVPGSPGSRSANSARFIGGWAR